jgi:hypothetical protein
MRAPTHCRKDDLPHRSVRPEDWLRWIHLRGSALLVGESFSVLVPGQSAGWLNNFGTLVHGEASDLVGERLDVTVVRRDGREIRVDLVLSVGADRSGRKVVIGVLRPHDGQQLGRMGRFTRQLLDVLTTTSDTPPVKQLLWALGHRLNWDVATLWGLESDGALMCRHVWTRTDHPAAAFVAEKRSDPSHGSDGLPRSVVETDNRVWVTDLASEERFMTGTTSADGLVCACAFPIRHQGQYVGAVKTYWTGCWPMSTGWTMWPSSPCNGPVERRTSSPTSLRKRDEGPVPGP